MMGGKEGERGGRKSYDILYSFKVCWISGNRSLQLSPGVDDIRC
jgi:hypothetical protein